MRFSGFLFIWISLLFTNISFAQDGRMLDSLELVKFYEATDGVNWDISLDLSLPMEQWEGIALNQNGRVIKIDFSSRGLNGILIDFQLPFLEVLNLNRNYRLRGAIPNFSNIPNLDSLILRGGDLSGGIPNFSNLRKLRYILLDFQELSDTIPNFTSLPELTYLSCRFNEIIGNIPDFTNLPKLTYFSCGFNDMTGPIVDFTNLPLLTTYNCQFNDLRGGIPDLQNLPLLEYFDCSSNDFLGGQLVDFTNLPKLEYFNCARTGLTGNLIDFQNLPELEEFIASFNFFSGEIPDFTNFRKLRRLIIHVNSLSGEIPDFSALDSLRNIAAYSNQLTGTIPNFTRLSLLESISLSNNQLTGSIPDFNNLPNLNRFVAWRNKLTNEIPDFSNLPLLEHFDVDDNFLTGNLPTFSNTKFLRILRVNKNQLSGAIPLYNNLDSLSSFSCNKNQLEGTIPNYSNRSNLSSFECDHNNLSGKIPTISNTPNLRVFSCGNNNLEGEIPDFSNFSELRYFACDSTGVSGQLPAFTNSVDLREVYAEGNSLFSIHPDFSKEHPRVNNIYLQENQFTFEDLLPFLNINILDSLVYNQQSLILTDTVLETNANLTFSINLKIDQAITSNRYTWYKNNTLYQTIEGNNTLTFDNIQFSDAGIYTVEVTNPNLPDLTLRSHSITIQVNEPEIQLAATIIGGEKKGASEETINIPVILNDLSNIAALEGTIQLNNPQIGQVMGIEAGLLDGILFNANTGNFNWFDANGQGVTVTNDTLFYLQIALGGEQGDSSLINFDAVKIWSFEQDNLTEVSATTQNGKVSILNNFALVGRIQNYQNKGINQTTVKLESDFQNSNNIDTTYTVLDGSYQLNQVRVGSDLVIEPSKEGVISNGLSSAALFLSQRFLLGFEVPNINSPFQLAAGDANCDGRMSIVDLFLIQRAIVGIDESFSNCPNWKFVPATEKDNFIMDANNYYPNYPFPMKATRDNQRTTAAIDFIGMKTGDILNRADLSRLHIPASGAARTSLGQPPLKFYFAEQQAITGDTLCMDLNIIDFQNIGSIQFSMNWDTSKLQFLQATSILADANINTNNSIAGNVALSWFDIEGKGVNLPDSTALLTLCFVAIDDSDGTAISIANEPTPIEIAQFDGISVNILEVESTATEVAIIPCDPISLGEDFLICPNSTQILDAIDLEGATFEWFRNEIAIFSADSLGTFEIAEAGSYRVKKKIADNCILQDTIEVALAPVKRTIQENFICGMVAARIDTFFLTSFEGCDSLVVIRNLPTSRDTLLLTTLTCSPQDTGSVTTLYNNTNGCDSLVIQQVSLAPFTTNFEVTIMNDNCQPNTSQVVITTNSSIDGPYIYSIDNGATFTTDSTFSNMPNGDYQIVIENVQGCQQLLPTNIQSPMAMIDLPETVDLLLGDSLQAAPLLTNANNVVVNWSPSIGLSCTDCLTPIIQPTQSTKYKLRMATQTGCIVEKEILVRIDDQLKLFIPNVFSPNADGQNDQLSVFTGLGITQIETFQIFNRWGALIYQANPVAEAIHWDGTVNGQDVIPGTYIWSLQLLKDNGKRVTKQGTVNLVR